MLAASVVIYTVHWVLFKVRDKLLFANYFNIHRHLISHLSGIPTASRLSCHFSRHLISHLPGITTTARLSCHFSTHFDPEHHYL